MFQASEFGGDVAFRVTERANIRGSFNFFHYDQTFDKDGIHYDGHVTHGLPPKRIWTGSRFTAVFI